MRKTTSQEQNSHTTFIPALNKKNAPQGNSSSIFAQNAQKFLPSSLVSTDAFIHIELAEHRRLLQLYYACYEENINPSAANTNARNTALAACNRFFEGMAASSAK